MLPHFISLTIASPCTDVFRANDSEDCFLPLVVATNRTEYSVRNYPTSRHKIQNTLQPNNDENPSRYRWYHGQLFLLLL